jgi:hypothetical protein
MAWSGPKEGVALSLKFRRSSEFAPEQRMEKGKGLSKHYSKFKNILVCQISIKNKKKKGRVSYNHTSKDKNRFY